MNTIACRPATEDDLPAVAKLYPILDSYYRQIGLRMPQPDKLAEAWLNSFRRTLGRFSNLFIAEVDEKMAGFALVRIKRTPPYYGGMLVGELSDIWIAEYARRLGVGEKLTQLAFDWLREQDVHSIELQVLEGNELGHKFFKRLGFSPELRQYRLVIADSRPLHA